MRLSLRSTFIFGGLFLLFGVLPSFAQCYTPEDLTRKANHIREELQYDFKVVSGRLIGDSLLSQRVIFDESGNTIRAYYYYYSDTTFWQYTYEFVDGKSVVRSQSTSTGDSIFTISYNTYDSACNCVETTTLSDGDTSSHHVRKYDANNRIIWTRYFDSPDTYGRASVTYDADGNATARAYVYDGNKDDTALYGEFMSSEGSVYHTEYDSQRRPIVLTMMDVHFDGTREILKAGARRYRVEYDYDPTGLMSEQRVLADGVLIQLMRYSYTKFGAD